MNSYLQLKRFMNNRFNSWNNLKPRINSYLVYYGSPLPPPGVFTTMFAPLLWNNMQISLFFFFPVDSSSEIAER